LVVRSGMGAPYQIRWSPLSSFKPVRGVSSYISSQSALSQMR